MLDTTSGDLEWVNCGHPAPLLLGPAGRDGETPRALDEGREPPLGVFEGVSPERLRLRLKPGERLIFYTDGVSEALDPDGALYGEERLLRMLAAAGPIDANAGVGESVGALVEAVLRDVEVFARGAPPADDLTLLALRLAGPA